MTTLARSGAPHVLPRRHAARAAATGSVLLGTALAGLLGAASASAVAPTALPAGACTDDTGITVVVDKTDLGGEVEVGCAPQAATGTEALQAAGFTDTRDAATMICAIDGLPDPCPTEFTGSYWAYWTASADGGWEQAQVGSDQAVPAPGGIEGWRYNDGAEPPTLAPADAATADDAADAVDDGASVTTTQGEPAQDEGAGDGSGVPPTVVAGIGVVAVLGAAAFVVARRRSPHGPAGQD
ncbi:MULTISPECIES: hypothetical protein [unclassified Actinotalea]|uniref:hypothetical protein n=1 Tax=unclassified Actinotalea TaxID=2638618 RepID=UPI0015F58838|nr:MULTISPECIES: hypothetical protein [unclassified Actinotalea]